MLFQQLFTTESSIGVLFYGSFFFLFRQVFGDDFVLSFFLNMGLVYLVQVM